MLNYLSSGIISRSSHFQIYFVYGPHATERQQKGNATKLDTFCSFPWMLVNANWSDRVQYTWTFPKYCCMCSCFSISRFSYAFYFLNALNIAYWICRSPLWSSSQNSCLQIQRSGFDSRRYHIFSVVGLERGPLSLVSTIEKLLERECSGPCLENIYYGRRGSAALATRHNSIRKSWH
jgi:hypothetical protein